MEDKLLKIVDRHNESTLLRKSQEECCELAVALSHYCLDREGSVKEMEKELADVKLHVILLEKIMKKHHGTELGPHVARKIDLIIEDIDNDNMISFKR